MEGKHDFSSFLSRSVPFFKQMNSLRPFVCQILHYMYDTWCAVMMDNVVVSALIMKLKDNSPY